MKKIVNIFVLLIMLITMISCEIVPRNDAVIEWVKYIDKTHVEIYGVGDWGYILPKTHIGIYDRKGPYKDPDYRHKIVDYKYIKRNANHLICEVDPPFYEGELVVVAGFGSLDHGGVIGVEEFTVPFDE